MIAPCCGWENMWSDDWADIGHAASSDISQSTHTTHSLLSWNHIQRSSNFFVMMNPTLLSCPFIILKGIPRMIIKVLGILWWTSFSFQPKHWLDKNIMKDCVQALYPRKNWADSRSIIHILRLLILWITQVFCWIHSHRDDFNQAALGFGSE